MLGWVGLGGDGWIDILYDMYYRLDGYMDILMNASQLEDRNAIVFK